MNHEERLYALQFITEEGYGRRLRQSDEQSLAIRNRSRAQFGLPPL